MRRWWLVSQSICLSVWAWLASSVRHSASCESACVVLDRVHGARVAPRRRKGETTSYSVPRKPPKGLPYAATDLTSKRACHERPCLVLAHLRPWLLLWSQIIHLTRCLPHLLLPPSTFQIMVVAFSSQSYLLVVGHFVILASKEASALI